MKKQNLNTIPESKKQKNRLTEAKRLLKNAKNHLKRKKTQLNHLEEDINDVLRNKIPDFAGKIRKYKENRIEIEKLQPQVKKLKGVRRYEKNEVMHLVDMAMDYDMIPPEILESVDDLENIDEQIVDDNTNRSADIFQQFVVEPKKEEQKDIRKIYISLAEKFHPDKAKNQEQAKEFHSKMQNIVEAYKRYDYEELLRLQNELIGDAELSSKDKTKSSIEEEILTLENQTAFYKNQAQRIQQQINKTKRSEIGEYYSMQKEQFPDGMLDEMSMLLTTVNEMTEGTIEIAQDFIKTKKINEKLFNELDTKAMEMQTNLMQMSGFEMEDDEFDEFDEEGENDGEFEDMMMQMFMDNHGPKPKKNAKGGKPQMSESEEEFIKEMLFQSFMSEFGDIMPEEKPKPKLKRKPNQSRRKRKKR